MSIPSVIVLNWRAAEMTARCVRSLLSSGEPMNVVIVDNGSGDGSTEKLRVEFPDLTLVASPSNVGFSCGVNLGLRLCLDRGDSGPFVLINNDAYVGPRFLGKALSVMEAYRDIGILGGKVLRSPQCKTFWYAGGRINFLRGQAIVRGFGMVDEGQYDVGEETEFVTLGLAMIRREALVNDGLLPEEYFFGYEEWDYSVRLRRAGWRLRYEPSFSAYHYGDGSHSNSEPTFVYNSYRNKLMFQYKNLPRMLWVLWFLLFRWFYVTVIAEKALAVHHGGIDPRPLMFALRSAIEDFVREGPTPIRAIHLDSFRRRWVKFDKGGR